MARQLRVELTFLDSLQQVAGRPTLWLEVPAPGTIARLLALLCERHPQFVGVAMNVLVNGAPSTPQQQLRVGDGVFLLPMTQR